MTSKEFVNKAIEISKLQTQYLMGGFGCRLGKDWYNENYYWNKDNKAKLEVKYNTNPITFGFDCVCLIKGILWGFNGDPNKEYGSAVYDKTTDFSVSQMMDTCSDLTTDFYNIEEGELVFLGTNHCGIYIGNGEVIESTPAWKCKVQRTLLPSRNSTNYEKLPVRNWDKHGHTSFIDYNSKNWRMAYEALLKKYDKLEKDFVHLNGKIETIKGVLEDDT